MERCLRQYVGPVLLAVLDMLKPFISTSAMILSMWMKHLVLLPVAVTCLMPDTALANGVSGADASFLARLRPGLCACIPA